MENQPQPTTASPSAGQQNLAGGWIRFLALIIDGIILGIVGSIIQATGVSASTAQNIQSLVTLIYLIVMIALKQQTVGMMALKLKVVSDKGDKVNWWGVAVLREFVGRILCSLTLGIGYLIIFWTKKKQGIHDMVSHTYVIREK